MGSWGSGTPYHPAAAQPAVVRWLSGDWRPALTALIAPTAVLLIAAMLAAIPDGYDFPGGGQEGPSYGDRLGAGLAAALTALGAPFEASIGMLSGSRGQEELGYVARVLPLTVTACWLVALWLGLRSGVRRLQQRTGAQLTRVQAFAEAARVALVAAAVTLVLGLVGGTTWRPEPRRRGRTPSGWDYADDYGYGSRDYGIEVGAGWAQAVGWTLLLAGLLAFLVYGTDALRWAAWRSRAVRGWAVAALVAGRAIAVSVGVAATAAFVVVAVQDEGYATGTSLAFLPNLGLLLLGFGAGATVRAQSGGSRLKEQDDWMEASFFDLQGASGDWRWAGLLAVAAALFLGWTAYRRRLDAADRLRLAAVYALGLTLLMALAGAAVTAEIPEYRGLGLRTEAGEVGLVFGTQLLANLIWAAVGALAVPAVLVSLRGPAPAPEWAALPQGAVPAQGGPGGSGTEGYPAGPAEVAGYAPGAPVAPYAPPAPPAPGAPPEPAAVPPAPVAGEVLGSHEEPSAAAPGSADRPAGGGSGEPGGEGPVDPSVWRKQP
ncbi:hypothetical protein ACWGB8_14445 [Kitasatospora sp. NPDC054939]